LRGAWVEGETLDTPRGRILLRQPSRASCVDYETRFGTPTFRASDSSAAIVSQTQWLWRPEPFPHELDASVRFVLPADGQVSLPWPRSDAIYFPEQSAFFTSVYGVFGSFDRQSFSVASTNVDIARLGSRPADDDTRRWLGRAVQATASLGGRFPRDRVHFIVGRRSGTGRQLASESRDMNRTGAYHRVYWAGAAFALETDVLLRKNSDDEMTLLRAISDAQRVWGSEARPVGASVLLKALQEASGAGFIEELGEKYAARAEFPNIPYVDSPEYREIRARITSSAHEACGVSAESSR
jgi:hypothetical protein